MGGLCSRNPPVFVGNENDIIHGHLNKEGPHRINYYGYRQEMNLFLLLVEVLSLNEVHGVHLNPFVE